MTRETFGAVLRFLLGAEAALLLIVGALAAHALFEWLSNRRGKHGR